MVSVGYIFSYRLKFKQLTKNIPNVENSVFFVFFCLRRARKLWLKISSISYIACISACPFLCLLLIFSLFSSFSSFLTVTVVRVDKSVSPFVGTLSWINKSYLLFFFISSTSQFLTVMFAGGSWCQSSHWADISSVQCILYHFFPGYFEIVISCMISSEELFYHTKQMWRNHSMFSYE